MNAGRLSSVSQPNLFQDLVPVQVVLLDAALDGGPRDCPLRLYILPKFPEDWTPEELSFHNVKDMTRNGGGKFFVPLITIGSLALIDLKTIDDAFHRAVVGSGEHPENVRAVS